MNIDLALRRARHHSAIQQRQWNTDTSLRLGLPEISASGVASSPQKANADFGSIGAIELLNVAQQKGQATLTEASPSQSDNQP
jgi:hypothetical protein